MHTELSEQTKQNESPEKPGTIFCATLLPSTFQHRRDSSSALTEKRFFYSAQMLSASTMHSLGMSTMPNFTGLLEPLVTGSTRRQCMT